MFGWIKRLFGFHDTPAKTIALDALITNITPTPTPFSEMSRRRVAPCRAHDRETERRRDDSSDYLGAAFVVGALSSPVSGMGVGVMTSEPYSGGGGSSGGGGASSSWDSGSSSSCSSDSGSSSSSCGGGGGD